jgi:ParB family chromosome partitioning protein
LVDQCPDISSCRCLLLGSAPKITTRPHACADAANDQTMLEMALVENIQREDLNSIEVALS